MGAERGVRAAALADPRPEWIIIPNGDWRRPPCPRFRRSDCPRQTGMSIHLRVGLSTDAPSQLKPPFPALVEAGAARSPDSGESLVRRPLRVLRPILLIAGTAPKQARDDLLDTFCYGTAVLLGNDKVSKQIERVGHHYTAQQAQPSAPQKLLRSEIGSLADHAVA
jgi:hypothetical protein